MSASQQVMAGSGGNGRTLIDVITSASLTTNLQLCLDAGDSGSYNAAVQTDKWLDRSGNGYDFYRGSGTGSDAADPTFNGAAGYPSSFWSFDGGDYFTYDAANETWMQNLHKNSAAFSVVIFSYGASTSNLYFLGDVGTPGTGMRMFKLAGIGPAIGVYNAGSNVLLKQAASDYSTGWHMQAWVIDEAAGAGGSFCYTDGAYNQIGGSDTFDATYSSPSAGSATNTFQIASLGGSVNMTGSDMACVAIWSSALTKANMDTIWAAMRVRFGI